MPKKTLLSLSVFLILLVGCQPSPPAKSQIDQNQKPSRSVVLISKDNGNNIAQWLGALDSTLTFKVAYGLGKDSLNYWLKNAKAVIIGGGEDVNPRWYAKPQYDSLCGNYDDYRDTLEIAMINYARTEKIPLMGICRGQQIINVAHGGSLLPDIPTRVKDYQNHRSKKDSAHILLGVEGTWLSPSQNSKTLWVNSRHHQAVETLAPHFTIAAYAPDSVIESIYISDTTVHPFTMAVQFHPENLRDSLANHFGTLLLKAIKD
jgi:putative glutamine amidotransferase